MNKQHIYLAALWHDIGKFWQRSEGKLKFKKHQLLSTQFVMELYDNNPIIKELVALHHTEDLNTSPLTGVPKKLAEIVCEADTLASGERQSDTGVKLIRQESIFNRVWLNQRNPPARHYQPLGHLSYEGASYPLPTPSADVIDEEYTKCWDDFLGEVEQLKAEQLHWNNHTLYFLLKKHLWCIPSAYYRNRADISLFEHSRLTAAIAICMYEALEGEKETLLLNANIFDRAAERYLLVVADITGIQTYIYNVGHTAALKALKGRSFYLQQLLDSVANHLLKVLALPIANLIYSSGGKFYMLLPNTDKAKQELASVEASVNERLLKRYRGGLGIAFAQIPLKGSDFQRECNKQGELYNISQKWAELDDLLSVSKKRKFIHQIKHIDFFTKTDFPFGNVGICKSTNIELFKKGSLREEDKNNIGAVLYRQYTTTDNAHTVYKTWEDDEPKLDNADFISAEQYDSQSLGYDLRHKAAQIVIGKNATHNILDLEKISIPQRDNQYQKHSDDIAYLLNKDEFMDLDYANKGWKFYGGNWTVEQDGIDEGIKDFKLETNEELEGSFNYWQEIAGKCTGMKYLAVLRMDVDYLGLVFKEGLVGEQSQSVATFSRMVQLSSMLDFFFSCYLNKLQDLFWSPTKGVHSVEGAQNLDLKRHLQIVYSGGDDLFIVGPWHVIPDVAIWIKNEFDEFTGHNPSMTLSAGIAMFHNKQPLFKVALLAGEAEKAAKNYSRPSKKDKEKVNRNAICFLGNPMSWNDFKLASVYAKEWYGWLTTEENRMPKAFLSIIEQIATDYLEPLLTAGKTLIDLTPKELEEVKWGRWRWQAAYRISRMGKRNDYYKSDLCELATDIFFSTKTEKDFLLVALSAAKWADYLTRTKFNNNDKS